MRGLTIYWLHISRSYRAHRTQRLNPLKNRWRLPTNIFKLIARILPKAQATRYFRKSRERMLPTQSNSYQYLGWLLFQIELWRTAQLKWAAQQVSAGFKTALSALRFLARKLKRLYKVQPSTHLTISYLRIWKQNLFTLLIKFTSSTHQQW